MAGLLVVAIAVMLGCDDNADAIRVYEVPKTTQHHGSALLSTPEGAQPDMPAAGQSPLSLVEWTMPAAWHQEPSNRPMILAIFHVDQTHTIEVQVSAFAGDAGGVLDNVNRWRKQINLDPITDAQLGDNVQIIDTQGSFGGVVDLTNTSNSKRTIATVIQGGAGMSWFVKASGEPDAVGKQKAAIIAFAESFRFKNPAADAHAGHDHSDPNHVHEAPAASATPTPGTFVPASMQGQLPAGAIPTGNVQLAKPDSWTQTQPSSPIILAAYNAKSAQGDAAVTVTSLNSDGGGLLPNINRWRNQLGLTPVASLSDQPVVLLNMTGVTAMLVDLEADPAGPFAGKRMMMAVVSRSSETWYFKMTGSVSALTELKSDFIAAVQSARFAGDAGR